MLLIRVKEIASPYVVIRLDEILRLEANQSHPWGLEILYFVHIFLCYLYLLPSKWVVGANYSVEKHLAFSI